MHFLQNILHHTHTQYAILLQSKRKCLCVSEDSIVPKRGEKRTICKSSNTKLCRRHVHTLSHTWHTYQCSTVSFCVRVCVVPDWVPSWRARKKRPNRTRNRLLCVCVCVCVESRLEIMSTSKCVKLQAPLCLDNGGRNYNGKFTRLHLGKEGRKKGVATAPVIAIGKRSYLVNGV